MNRIDFSHPGGFPLETDTLNFLQASLAKPISALTGLGGENYIVSGATQSGDNISDGWVVIKGELLPFKGGITQMNVTVVEISQEATFMDGAIHPIYFTRQVQLCASGTVGSIPFASILRMNNLQEQKIQIDDLLDKNKKHENLLQERQHAAAVLENRVIELEKCRIIKGMIMAWSGSINAIPMGWKLCDLLKDKFILGAGGSYALGTTGGTATHTLTVEEMPEHHHQQASDFSNYDTNSGTWHNPSTPSFAAVNTGFENRLGAQKNATTFKTGGSKPHNNMPPYYALAYIEYIG